MPLFHKCIDYASCCHVYGLREILKDSYLYIFTKKKKKPYTVKLIKKEIKEMRDFLLC